MDEEEDPECSRFERHNDPDDYLPGAISLLEEIDKKLLVVLRDGRTLIGFLRTIDQFANLVLHRTIERIHVGKLFGDIPRGVFMIRGENVVLAGVIDPEKESTQGLQRVSVQEILAKQRESTISKTRLDEARNRALKGRGLMPRTDPLQEDNYS